MKRFAIVLPFFLVTILFANCSRDFNPISPKGTIRPLTQTERQLAKRGTHFTWKLFKPLALEEDQNVVVSPFSVAFAVGMALNGAKGETEQAILETLDLSGLSLEQINSSFSGLMKLLTTMDPKVQMEIANSVWYRMGLDVQQDFQERLSNYFQAEIQALNFSDPSAVDIINRWVETKTHGKIKRIIDNLGNLDMMCLINVLYFKAMWTIQFSKKETREDSFYVQPGQAIPVKMMSVIDDFEYTETPMFQAVNLPYGDRYFQMTVLLPKEGVPVDSVVSQLNTTTWEQWQASMSSMRGQVKLPKFKVEYKKSLVKVLKQLGMDICFSPERADFSGITTQERLYIGDALHKTFVAVDEEGTEAAAVTAIVMRATSVQIPGVQFTMKVNRPFLFVIWERYTRAVLFVGKMIQPTSS